ncbi:MAG TPA: ParB-like protein [Caulobacteraceae bacterium]|nr:ParB-like protein [Caulobacteraceae bacterium]
MSAREPVLNPVPIKSLKPTQMTVGLREVKEKRAQWRDMGGAKGSEFLGRHMIPAVLGPKRRLYAIDHHHLARALWDEGVKDVLVNVVADLSRLAKIEFWVFLDNRGWCHPYDAEGVRRAFDDIPDSMIDLADDPFRSLAGELRGLGGYAKDTTPFSEFIWADFLRRRIKRKAVDKDFAQALHTALILAKSKEADHLPGWCGPTADD